MGTRPTGQAEPKRSSRGSGPLIAVLFAILLGGLLLRSRFLASVEGPGAERSASSIDVAERDEAPVHDGDAVRIPHFGVGDEPSIPEGEDSRGAGDGSSDHSSGDSLSSSPKTESSPGRIRLRFIDDLGSPMADVPVEVAWWRGFGDHGDRSSRTDEDGTVLGGVDEAWQLDSVSTEAFGGRPPLYHSGPFRTAPSNSNEVRVRVGAPGRIQGLVLGLDGEAVSDAEVRLGVDHVLDAEAWVHRLAGYGQSTHTDPEGRFEFAAVSGFYDLEVAQGFGVMESASFEYRAEEGPLELEFRSIVGMRRLDVRVVLPRGRADEPSVWATWTDDEGRAIEGARRVEWHPETLVRRGAPNDQGWFQIDGLHGGEWTLHVRGKGCRAVNLPIPPEVPELTVELELAESQPSPEVSMLRGIVRGTPERTSARISVRDPVDLSRRFDHSTDLDGEFEFSLGPLDGGTFYVMAAHRDRAFQVLGPFEVAAVPNRIEFNLQAGSELRGRVVDRNGHPVAAVLGLYPSKSWLDPSGAGEPGELEFLPRSLFDGRRTTGPAGEFSFESLDGGAWELWAWPEDGRGPPARRVVRGGVEVVLRLGDGLESLAALEGRVFDALTRGSIEGARVGVRPLGPSGAQPMTEGVSDGEGRIRVDGLAPGTYSFLLEAKGYAFGESGPFPLTTGATEVELPMLPARVLRLELRDRGGRPLAGWEVRAFDGAGRGIGLQDGYGGWAGEVERTDAAGRVELAGLPRAEVTVLVGVELGDIESLEGAGGIGGLGPEIRVFPFDLRVPGDDFHLLELDTR